MKIEINMLQFLKTGALGPIHLGMSREAIINILGEPPMWGGKKGMMWASIWRYDDFEIWFPDKKHEDTGNTGIFSDHLPLESGEYFGVDPWYLHPSLDIDKAMELLEKEGIKYVCSGNNDYFHYSKLELESGVHLTFHPSQEDESDKHPYLTGFSVVASSPASTHKQIGTFVSLEIYKQLQEISKRTRVKISEICSQWITERAEQELNKN